MDNLIIKFFFLFFVEANTEKTGLYSTAKLIIYIDQSVLTDTSPDLSDDLLYHPIWSNTNLITYVYENSPINTWLAASALNSSDLLTAASALNSMTLSDMESRGISSGMLNIEIVESDMFEIEPRTGYIQTRMEFDYEKMQRLNVNLRVCHKQAGMQCFKQLATLEVNIMNRNDNEPTLKTRYEILFIYLIIKID